MALVVKVIELFPVVGLVPSVAVIPLGRPETFRVTLPMKPFRSVTLMVSVPLLPCATERVLADGASEKLPPVPFASVIVNASVLLQAAALV